MQVSVLECGCQITDGEGYIVLMIVCWDCKVVREKVNSMGNFLSLGIRDVCLVVAAVVWAVPNIPSINTMLSPSFALLCCFVD